MFVTRRMTRPPFIRTRVTTYFVAQITVPAKQLRLFGADGQFELLHGGYELHVGGRAPGAAPGGVEAPLTTMLRVE